MVNFILIVDSNRKRRLSYFEKIEPLISPVEGLTISSCLNEDFGAIWAAGAWTPISCVSDNKGVAIVFGDAIKGPGSERLTAEQLRNWWNRSKLPNALDGFHAATVYSPKKGLTVGADLLGIFPIYYYASDEVILVGSSPELFQHHPSFRMRFNPSGFVGILLTKGTFEGQTLLCGVKRLSPGHLLLCRLGEPAMEVLQFTLPVSTKYFDLDFSEQVELLDRALEEAILRHVPKGDTYCLMLSGGLDSRLVGGYLSEKDLDVVAFTEGLPTDNEMRRAKPVANTLGFRHVAFDMGFNNYPHYAQLEANWQHLSTGFDGILFWGYSPLIQKIANRVVTGYFGTEILGHLFQFAVPRSGKPISFEAMFRYFNSLAVSPSTLTGLLKEEYFGDLVSETLHRVKKAYESYSGLKFQRVWRYGLHQHARFHVGRVAWILSFGSWPVLPFLDSKVLETAGGMPIEALMNRRTEKELLCRKFPKLARLPLIAEVYDATPLVPTPRQRGLQQIIGNEGIWRSRVMRYIRRLLIVSLRGEKRYYPRLWDINSLGWKTVQKSAESYLDLTSRFLNEDMVQNSIALSNSRFADLKCKMTSKKRINAAGLKILMGFALWLGSHSEAT